MRFIRYIASILIVAATIPAGAMNSSHGTGTSQYGSASFSNASGAMGGVSFYASRGVAGEGWPPPVEVADGGYTCVSWRKTDRVYAGGCGTLTATADPALTTATLQGSISGYLMKFTSKKNACGYQLVAVGPAKRITITVSGSWLGDGAVEGVSGWTGIGVVHPDGTVTETSTNAGAGGSTDPGDEQPNGQAGVNGGGSTDTRNGYQPWNRIALGVALSRRATGSISIGIPGYGTTSGAIHYGRLYSTTGTQLELTER